VAPIDRFRAYPGEPFTVSNRKLFCSASREELATKKSVIELHLKSVKHSRGKERFFFLFFFCFFVLFFYVELTNIYKGTAGPQ